MKFLETDFSNLESIDKLWYFYNFYPNPPILKVKEDYLKEGGYINGDITLAKLTSLVSATITEDELHAAADKFNGLSEQQTLYLRADMLSELQNEIKGIMEIIEKFPQPLPMDENFFENDRIFKETLEIIKENINDNVHFDWVVNDFRESLIVGFEIQFKDVRTMLYYAISQLVTNDIKTLRCKLCNKYIYMPKPTQISNARHGKPTLHAECAGEYRRQKDRVRKQNQRLKGK